MIPLTDKQVSLIMGDLSVNKFEQTYVPYFIERTTDIFVDETFGMPVNAFRYSLLDGRLFDLPKYLLIFHIHVRGFDFSRKLEQNNQYTPWTLVSDEYCMPADKDIDDVLRIALDKSFIFVDKDEIKPFFVNGPRFEDEWTNDQIVEYIKGKLSHDTYHKIGSHIYPFKWIFDDTLADRYENVNISTASVVYPWLTKEAAAIELAKNV